MKDTRAESLESKLVPAVLECLDGWDVESMYDRGDAVLFDLIVNRDADSFLQELDWVEDDVLWAFYARLSGVSLWRVLRDSIDLYEMKERLKEEFAEECLEFFHS